jgi:magnesium transporter
MNFEFMPELRHKWGYPGVYALMAVITLGIYLWFKRKGWL